MDMDQLINAIEAYTPFNEQEMHDKELILHFLRTNSDAFLRSNTLAHMTASAWVVNQARTRVLMVYHNLYHSWSWTGGHADGETDLLAVALRECREETGIKSVRPVSDQIYSIEVLNVEGHIKHGQYVSSHLHLNVTYLLQANENDALTICEAENSGVQWFDLARSLKAPTEPWMVQNIYKKLNAKLS